jgi:Fe-S-cluster containining protein
VAENGCTGACCAAFTLNYTPLELALRMTDPAEPWLEDGVLIAAMVVPLTAEEADLRLEAAGGEPISVEGGEFYTCRYWDPDTRLCRNYEGRPAMCRNYPGGQECRHATACTCVGIAREEGGS